MNGGIIADLTFEMPHAILLHDAEPQEHVAIRYRDITWTHYSAGTSGYSTWGIRVKPTIESCMPGSCDYWMVSAAAGKLGSQASTLGVRHIKDGALRLQFNREVAYYAKSIVDDVSQGKKALSRAYKILKTNSEAC